MRQKIGFKLSLIERPRSAHRGEKATAEEGYEVSKSASSRELSPLAVDQFQSISSTSGWDEIFH